jgi:hypothetical protein
MVMNRITQFVLILCIAVGCSTREKHQNATTNAPVLREFIVSYYTVMSSRNWSTYRSYFWDSATITNVWQKPLDTLEKVHIGTIDQFIQETPNGPDSQPIFEEYMTSFQEFIYGNVAIVIADYEAKFGNVDSLMEWKGKDVFTLMNHQNEWRIVSLVFEAEH